jgi:putative CRISPR-associated protein (TIGR02619 family)
MYHTVVMTCGISLIQGKSYFSVTRDGQFKGLLPYRELQKSITELTADLEVQIENYIEKARKYLRDVSEHRESICAEYSMINALKRQKKLTKDVKVTLIFTNTIGGFVCEQLLRLIFEKEGIHVNVQYIDMTVANEKDLKNQSATYLKRLGDALAQGDPDTTCFAPIGGYKILTALGYLVGSFLHYPMVYLHENTQILVEIPPMPLGIDEDFINNHFALLRKCQHDYVDFDELSHFEKQVVDKYPALFSREEGFISLSAFGVFLFERKNYAYIFQTNFLLSEQVERFIRQNRHQSIFIFGQLYELVKKLESGLNIDDLRHESEFERLDSKKLLFNLYKGSSNGRDIFRCTYKYDPIKKHLYINYLWLDHKKYELEVVKGIGLYTSEKNFIDYTDEIVSRKRK